MFTGSKYCKSVLRKFENRHHWRTLGASSTAWRREASDDACRRVSSCSRRSRAFRKLVPDVDGQAGLLSPAAAACPCPSSDACWWVLVCMYSNHQFSIDILVRSPRKSCTFIIWNIIYWIKVSHIMLTQFWKQNHRQSQCMSVPIPLHLKSIRKYSCLLITLQNYW